MKREVDSAQWYQDALIGEGEPYHHNYDHRGDSHHSTVSELAVNAKEKAVEIGLLCVNAAGDLAKTFMHYGEYSPQQLANLRLQKARRAARRVSLRRFIS